MIEFPKKKYQIIYADPPWLYNDKSKSHGGGAESHYDCMATEEICKLPVSKISKDNSVLLLWTTFPQLKESFKVIEAWGFEYKTVGFVWIKTNSNNTIYMGMGRYTRSNAEICLLATKGKSLKRNNKSIINTQILKREKHSVKPDYFRILIEKLFGKVSRIELFARQKYSGWDVWGNEVPNSQQERLGNAI